MTLNDLERRNYCKYKVLSSLQKTSAIIATIATETMHSSQLHSQLAEQVKVNRITKLQYNLKYCIIPGHLYESHNLFASGYSLY